MTEYENKHSEEVDLSTEYANDTETAEDNEYLEEIYTKFFGDTNY